MSGIDFTSAGSTGQDFTGGTYTQVYAETLAELRTLDGNIAILGGYYAAGDGGGGTFVWSDTTAVDDGGVVVNATAGSTAAGWRRLVDGDTLSVLWFGAQANETADATREARNTAAIARAIASTGATISTINFHRTIYFPPGVYWLESAITIPSPGQIYLRGAGKFASQIKSRNGGCISFATGTIQWIRIESLRLESSAGHLVSTASGSGSLIYAVVSDVYLKQTSTSHSIWSQDARGLLNSTFEKMIVEMPTGSSVPGWDLKNTASFANNVWRESLLQGGDEFMVAITNNSATTLAYGNRFEDLTLNALRHGGIKGLGVRNLAITNCIVQAIGTLDNHVIRIGPSTNASPLASKDCVIENYARSDGTLVGYDVVLDSGTINTSIDGAAAYAGTSLKLALNDTTTLMTGVRDTSITVTGAANLTWLWPTSLVLASQTGLFTGDGDPNGAQDGAKGSLYMDHTNDTLYKKTTDFGTLTGWVEMAEAP